ncbi:Deoxynucleotidyltransferase terminal-interacting protein 1 [Myotis davidii]|uniref:Deoxynucleotidyltransferase terminal-interacting protein 1 n=1 Tax=Myotis davidii TaxID=225400 RepID=L5MJC5_MYODS|nr:Deoxynucleotidyltransferase terminal-interacting protein 1 [Myotis davidii]
MDLLRAVLQPSINEEIQTMFNKYMKFFQKAALNVISRQQSPGDGGTRGRIYIKHPHLWKEIKRGYLFKYAADPQDKHWLAEQHHMRATGGKMAYLLIEEDIQDLAASDDYRGCLDLKLEELKSFVLPSWIVEKMRKYMETQWTENEHHADEAPPQT